jgi:hypothetical protein
MGKGKPIGVIILIIIVAMSVLLITAQEEAYAQTTNDEGGGSASAGGLSASIAKSNYNAGDTVVINGTVAKYTPTSVVIIEVIDPKGRVVEEGRPAASGGKFRFTFTAGENVQFDPNHWMLLSGDYTVEVRYTPPSIGTSPAREQVELHFNYNNGAAANTSTTTTDSTEREEQQPPLPPPPPPASPPTTPPPPQQEQNMTITSPSVATADDLSTTTTNTTNNNATTTTNATTMTTAPTTNTTTTTTTTAAPGATNATTTNATTTQIVTSLIWNPGEEPEIIGGIPIGGEEVQQLSPQNIQYQQTDPAFAKLAQTTADCLNDYNAILQKIEANPQFRENPGSGTAYTAEDIQRQDLCTDVIRQGIDHFCESTDFATFDIQKCEEARNMSERYVQVVEVIFG